MQRRSQHSTQDDASLIHSKQRTEEVVNLHQSLQLVELAVKILKVVSVESSEAVVVHDLHQHTEGLLLWHLQSHAQFHKRSSTNAGIHTGKKGHLQALSKRK